MMQQQQRQSSYWCEYPQYSLSTDTITVSSSGIISNGGRDDGDCANGGFIRLQQLEIGFVRNLVNRKSIVETPCSLLTVMIDLYSCLILIRSYRWCISIVPGSGGRRDEQLWVKQLSHKIILKVWRFNKHKYFYIYIYTYIASSIWMTA